MYYEEDYELISAIQTYLYYQQLIRDLDSEKTPEYLKDKFSRPTKVYEIRDLLVSRCVKAAKLMDKAFDCIKKETQGE